MAGRQDGLAELDAPTASAAEVDFHGAVRLSAQGRPAEAEPYLREAFRLRPDDIDVLNELGLAIWRQGRAAEAEPIYRRACGIDPDDFRILSNLGLAVYDQGRVDEAGEYYRRAIEIEPGAFDAMINLALVRSDQGKFEEATHWLDVAARLRPDSADLLHIVGINLGRQGRWREAVETYEHGLRIEPNYVRMRLNLAYALLCPGEYERGWRQHEWRLKWRDHQGCKVNRPFWKGDDLQGRTILVHTEQGLGDTLQLIRLAPLVKARGGFVVLCCPTRLLRLVARCEGVDLAIDGSSFIPECHVHAPLMSLPAILGTTLANLPARVPYLVADGVLADHWRAELARLIGPDRDGRPFLIGIAWQGSPAHRLDRWRSFPLAQFARLAELPNVRLVSLQSQHGLDQIGPLAARVPIIELPNRRDRDRDFADTAAVMSHLDLVITPDTAVAHLAGGLGLRVWVGLNAIGDWRWLVGREDSPWYPTMRLFHQTTLGDWDDVFRRMADALRAELPRTG